MRVDGAAAPCSFIVGTVPPPPPPPPPSLDLSAIFIEFGSAGGAEDMGLATAPSSGERRCPVSWRALASSDSGDCAVGNRNSDRAPDADLGEWIPGVLGMVEEPDIWVGLSGGKDVLNSGELMFLGDAVHDISVLVQQPTGHVSR
jgi:hypothetical protein